MDAIKQTLVGARALIEKPEHWAKGTFYYNGCYCAIGAVAKMTGDLERRGVVLTEKSLAAIDVLSKHANGAPKSSPINMVTNFNDCNEHADVLAMFDRAIASRP